jgi:arginase
MRQMPFAQRGYSNQAYCKCTSIPFPLMLAFFVHFDVDILRDDVMPAAYTPNERGLSIYLVREVMQTIFSDPRVKGIEVCEFCPPKDPSGHSAKVIVDLLSECAFSQ